MKPKIVAAVVTVFRHPRYAFAASFLSVLVFFLFILANNLPAFISALKITLSPVLLMDVLLNAASNILYGSGIVQFNAVVGVSILSGITISMIGYQINAVKSFKSKSNVTGIGGVLGGALSSACAACTTTLISAIGVAGGLSVFPFRGLELSGLSIGLLMMSIYLTSKDIVKGGTCDI